MHAGKSEEYNSTNMHTHLWLCRLCGQSTGDAPFTLPVPFFSSLLSPVVAALVVMVVVVVVMAVV